MDNKIILKWEVREVPSNIPSAMIEGAGTVKGSER